MPDRIEETLVALHVDVARAGLPDSGAVRRRGDRRTRNQAIGSAFALVALVAGVAGAYAGLGGDRRAVDIPAKSPTVSTSQEEPLRLAADPLLMSSTLDGVGIYEGWRRNDTVDETTPPSLCVSSPTTWGATRTVAGLHFSDLDAQVVQHVLLFPDAASAEAAAARPLTELRRCPAGDLADARVDERPDEAVAAVGDQASRASRLTTPKADAGIGYYELGVARDQNVVVVLQWVGMGNPVGEGAQDWVWTAERLGATLDRAASVE